jgi:hypothetical protein
MISNKNYLSSFRNTSASSDEGKDSNVVTASVPMPTAHEKPFEIQPIPEAPILPEYNDKRHWITTREFWLWVIPTAIAIIGVYFTYQGVVAQKQPEAQASQSAVNDNSKSAKEILWKVPETLPALQIPQQKILDVSPLEQNHPDSSKNHKSESTMQAPSKQKRPSKGSS